MLHISGKELFYGLENVAIRLDEIVRKLNVKQQCFEIKLIMMEAITNAFIHGNNSDASKPIELHYELKNNLLSIEVSDCGNGFKNISISKKINEDDIFKESGRGLYIISCYVDDIQFKSNSIIMKKYVNYEVVL